MSTTMPAKRLGTYHVHGPIPEMFMHTMDSGLGQLSNHLIFKLRHTRIPMAVLYGVFLYMGISSLRDVQMVQRTSLFFMPIKYQPDYTFLR
ncbi:unnamed protein product [Protopolystoma xenopodis]|uniref:Bicarbonate transporter-like transmembrane domain-containing protein n=1 Tax=Protopolystoma xenopodis TaxID=117903 RepID=A0A3S5BRF7_9PLAT|nr:unnamed protein product [Protopolystoma xenopodis]